MKNLLLIGILLISVGCRHVADANETFYQETKASTLLERYSRFKDMHANLSSKLAGIEALKKKITGMEDDYAGVPRSEWQRADIQALNQWRGELDALKLSYNSLAAQYNSEMAKANVSYTNVGDLPKGATQTLPREVAPYIEN